jgi:chaperonin GroES
MSKLNPLADRIVATIIKSDNKTNSGLYLPEGAKEKSLTANVISTGPSVREVKVNDIIIFREYSVINAKIDGQDFIILKEEDVLATISK